MDERTHGRRQNYIPPTSSADNKTPKISELASLRNLDSGSDENNFHPWKITNVYYHRASMNTQLFLRK